MVSPCIAGLYHASDSGFYTWKGNLGDIFRHRDVNKLRRCFPSSIQWGFYEEHEQ
jgi:hypothetical protein